MNVEQTFLDILNRQLLKEESILWFGRPNIKGLFSKEDIFSIFVGIAFIGGSSIWIVYGVLSILGISAQNSNNPVPASVCFLMAVPFIVAGYCSSIGKALKRKHRREKTVYVITNKRLLTLELNKREKVISKYISQINQVDISTNSYGIGTIIFGEKYSSIEFSDIKEVQVAYELINELRSKV